MILEANTTAGHLLGRSREALIGTLLSSYVSRDSYKAYYGHMERVFETRTKQTCEIQLERADGVQFAARFDSVAVKNADGYFTRWRIIMDDITALKRAEDALRESEELHRITLSSISDTVLITDDNDTFTYVCPNVHVIFGYSKEEVGSFDKVSRLLGPDLFDRSEFSRREEIPNIERTIMDKAGVEHVLLINVKRVSIKGGTTLFSCRDITDLRRAEEVLQASRPA
jgi:HTH-type transcriptional regulator, bacterioopsin transcriptional activator and related proteins